MKLVELRNHEFDTLAKAEPGNTFYQTSSWAKFYSRFNYEPIYLGYIDDNSVYEAFGLFLIKKKEGLFAKSEAICPWGFLINYHDNDLLASFTNDLKKYLSKIKVGQLTICPNVPYLTARGNNEILIKNLNALGYKKSKDNAFFNTDATTFGQYGTDSNVVLNTYVADKECMSKLFKMNKNYENLYTAFPTNTTFIVSELDNRSSNEKINKTIDKHVSFINKNEDKAKRFDEIVERKKIVDNEYSLLHTIEKCIKENGNNPILGITCLLDYNNKITQLFIDEKNGYEVFKSVDALNCALASEVLKRGYTSFDSYTSNPNANKIELIGEYTLKI